MLKPAKLKFTLNDLDDNPFKFIVYGTVKTERLSKEFDDAEGEVYYVENILHTEVENNCPQYLIEEANKFALQSDEWTIN